MFFSLSVLNVFWFMCIFVFNQGIILIFVSLCLVGLHKLTHILLSLAQRLEAERNC